MALGSGGEWKGRGSGGGGERIISIGLIHSVG